MSSRTQLQSDSTSPEASTCAQRAIIALKKFQFLRSTEPTAINIPTPHIPLPRISQERINQALSPSTLPTDNPTEPAPTTVLYLAYGSNLAAITFLSRRGIRPLSAINVLVPSLALSFDLPGIPYSEPCFANTRHRSPSPPSSPPPDSPKPPSRPPYHKDAWRKPLVGVVYEVTPSDYAHIIATEGGGAAYTDILVPCHALLASSTTVPENPTTPGFLAHTLFAPSDPTKPRRPDPSYAQPSARYLELITTGAAEHALPAEYRTFLAGIRPYTMTSEGQRVGAWIFLGIWTPIIRFLFTYLRKFVDEKGRSPPWVVRVMRVVFAGCWGCYDWVFKPIFGNGERTVEGEGEKKEGEERWRDVEKKKDEGREGQRVEKEEIIV